MPSGKKKEKNSRVEEEEGKRTEEKKENSSRVEEDEKGKVGRKKTKGKSEECGDEESKEVKLPSTEDNPDNKGVDKEKLKEAKKLMDDAKKMASEQPEIAEAATKKKMEEILRVLELPSDWNKQDIASPDQMLKELDGVIQQYSNALKDAESYKSDLEVVSKASGGRVLFGVYYSKYQPPLTAGRPILLMPANITLSNPTEAMKLDCLKFSESRLAAEHVQTMESTSNSIGIGLTGFYGGFVGELKGAYSSQEESDKTRSVKSHSTSASVVQRVWAAKRCFRIQQEEMKLSQSALRMAKAIRREDDAHHFMENFGSHIPAGVQTLGGVFFSVAEVESEATQKVTTLTTAATTKLQGQFSFGFVGEAVLMGGSAKGERQTGSGKKEAEQEEDTKSSYSFSVHSMGPAATNPAIFLKMLSYNSTWALIDRGPHRAYIPVWELLTDLGSDYESAAKVLSETWKKGESEKEEHWRRINEKRQREETLRTQLMKLKEEYEKRGPEKDFGYWPKNGNMFYAAYKLKWKDAFEKATELVMADPQLNICEIFQRDEKFFTLKCWKASDQSKMEFDKSPGYHILFYSSIEFKWKEEVPVKAECKHED